MGWRAAPRCLWGNARSRIAMQTRPGFDPWGPLGFRAAGLLAQFWAVRGLEVGAMRWAGKRESGGAGAREVAPAWGTRAGAKRHKYSLWGSNPRPMAHRTIALTTELREHAPADRDRGLLFASTECAREI